jgi:hypothetical protein
MPDTDYMKKKVRLINQSIIVNSYRFFNEVTFFALIL